MSHSCVHGLSTVRVLHVKITAAFERDPQIFDDEEKKVLNLTLTKKAPKKEPIRLQVNRIKKR